jgi:hypothetical protein
MSDRTKLRLFKEPAKDTFLGALRRAVADQRGQLFWGEISGIPDEDLRISHNADVHVLYLPYLYDADFTLCERIGTILGAAWLELRIQEEALWEITAFQNAEVIQNFSPLPEYWDEDLDVSQLPADPGQFASLWSIPVERIERYFRRWGMVRKEDDTFDTVLRGRAYPEDEHEYGDPYQMYDVLAAFGGLSPINCALHGQQHRIVLPLPKWFR